MREKGDAQLKWFLTETSYLAHAQCLTKKSVQWGGGKPCKEQQKCTLLDGEEYARGEKEACRNNPTAQCLMRKSVHSERMKNDHTAQVQTWASIADTCGHACVYA